MEKRKDRKVVLLYMSLAAVLLFVFSVVAVTISKTLSLTTQVSYSNALNYAVEVGYDKDADDVIEESEYVTIYSNFSPSGTIPTITNVENVIFMGENSFMVQDSALAVGDYVNVRVTNYNQAANFDANVYTKGVALSVTATKDGVVTTCGNIKPYSANDITNGIIKLAVTTAGSLQTSLAFAAQNYHNFDLKDAIASPATNYLTFSEAANTETTILITGQTFEASNPDSLLSLSAIVGKKKVVSTSGGFDNSNGVNNSMSGTTINLNSNIDFSSAGNVNSYTNGTNFLPIGDAVDEKFQGTFVGNSKTIKGIKIIDSALTNGGLFGTAQGNISNITFDACTIQTDSWSGVAVGRFGEAGSTSTISNITVNSTCSMSSATGHSVGGVVGLVLDSNTSNLQNLGAAVSGQSRVGGVAGAWSFTSTGSFAGCGNAGTVTATGFVANAWVGGVIGYVGKDNTVVPTVSNCTNSGNVSASGDEALNITTCAGGVVGDSEGVITGCTNSGDVQGFYGIGGVAGALSGTSAKILASSNTGDITGYMGVGGIAGHTQSSTIEGTSSAYITSSGTISGAYTSTEGNTDPYCIGGIVGMATGTSGAYSTISYVQNTGTVSGAKQQLGGVAGGAQMTNINYGKNTAAVTGQWRVGGIVGRGEDSNISNSENSGVITGTLVDTSTQVYVGGIAGTMMTLSSTTSITSCTNSAQVVAPLAATTNTSDYADSLAGGIVGFMAGTVTSCTTTSTASVTGWSDVGGICGNSVGEVKSCTNNGAVSGIMNIGGLVGRATNGAKITGGTNNYVITASVNGTAYTTYNIGGYVGYLDQNASMTGVNNTKAVTGSNAVGGLVGYLVNNASITSCTNAAAITGAYMVGGIAGVVQDSVVTSCQNKSGGNITTPLYGGGICGSLKQTTKTAVSKLVSCSNAAGVNVFQMGGGISGETSGTISKCSNSGAIVAKTVTGYPTSATVMGWVGGITGYSDYVDASLSASCSRPESFARIFDCNNSGSVYCQQVSEVQANYTGGIVGYKYKGPASGCYNTGTIGLSSHTNSIGVGGVFGYAEGAFANCYNTGAVYGTVAVGGIAGTANWVDAANLWNTGAIKASSEQGGGIIGQSVGAGIANSYNNGKISGGAALGGICGFVMPDSRGILVKNCYNLNTVSGAQFTGGIIGYFYQNGTVQNCYNQGAISASTQLAGGIAGYIASGGAVSISGCTNYSTVTSPSVAGGVVALMTAGTVTACNNAGAVTGGTCVGGLIGQQEGGTVGGSSANKCCNYAKITTTSTSQIPWIGGCYGLLYAGTASYTYNYGSVAGPSTSVIAGNWGAYATSGVTLSYYYTTTSASSISAYPVLTFDASAGSVGAANATGTVSAASCPTSSYTTATLLTALNNYKNSNTTVTDTSSAQYGGSNTKVTLNSWASASPWPTVTIVAVAVSPAGDVVNVKDAPMNRPDELDIEETLVIEVITYKTSEPMQLYQLEDFELEIFDGHVLVLNL